MRVSRTIGLALASLLMISTLARPVSASLITRTFNFTASGFGQTAPVDPLIGSVSVAFDPMGETFPARRPVYR